MFKAFKIILSWIYAIIVAVRNKMFDWNISKSEEYDIPVVCVGNIAVGGTGKTPHVEMLIEILSHQYNIAVLSRGYKRKTKGYRSVKVDSLAKDVGDEPKQIKSKYPHVHVAVCESRRSGISIVRKNHPEVNLIIMDDGFQHRYVETWLNIILTDYSNPIYDDHILPHGSLRESKSSLSRAQVIVMTKVPEDIKSIDLRIATKRINAYPYQSLFFTNMVQSAPIPVFEEYYGQLSISRYNKCIAMAGIAKPDSFFDQLSKKYTLVDKLSFDDHHKYKISDLKLIVELLKKHGDNSVVLMTEKDAVKFSTSRKIPAGLRRRMFYVPIKAQFISTDDSRHNTKEDFINKIMPYVEKNQKYNMLHP